MPSRMLDDPHPSCSAMLRVAVILPSLWLATPALAQDDDGDQKQDVDPLTYFFVSADYRANNPSDGPDSEGYGLSGSTPLTDNMNLFGSYTETETDDFQTPGGLAFLDSTGYSLGLGWHTALSPIADFGLSVAYVRSEAEGRGALAGQPDDRKDGYGVGISMRSWLRRGLEFSAGGGIERLSSDSNTSFSLGLTWNFTRAFALGSSFSFSNDSTGWSGGLRYTLG